MNTTPEGAKKPAGSGKFRRQLSSRLQMHAPSSIQVRAPPADISEWNVAIPLLSPLDIVAIPRIPDEAPQQAEETGGPSASDGGVDRKEEQKKKQHQQQQLWRSWQHPAAPFYYEPVPGNAPAFILPHCA